MVWPLWPVLVLVLLETRGLWARHITSLASIPLNLRVEFHDSISVCKGCCNKVTDWVTWTTEMGCLTVLKAECPNSGCQQGLFLLRAGKENLFHSSLPVSGSLRHSLSCKWHSLGVFTWFSLWVWLFPNFPFYKNTSHIRLEPTLLNLF